MFPKSWRQLRHQRFPFWLEKVLSLHNDNHGDSVAANESSYHEGLRLE